MKELDALKQALKDRRDAADALTRAENFLAGTEKAEAEARVAHSAACDRVGAARHELEKALAKDVTP